MFRLVTVVLVALMVLGTVPAVEAQSGYASRSEACSEVAPEMLGDGSTYSVDQVAVYTGCALSTSGRWFWPDTGEDSVLAKNVGFTSAELERIAPLLDELLKEIEAFNQLLDRLENPHSIGVWESFGDALARDGIAACSSGTGGISRYWIEDYEEIYVQVMDDPNFVVFAGFSIWWSGSRASAQPVSTTQLPPGWDMSASMYWMRPPWPFEQLRVYNQQLFFRWLIDTGQIAV